MPLKKSRGNPVDLASVQLEEALQKFFDALNVPKKEWEDRGLDIRNTPKRVAKSYREMLASYAPGAEEALISTFTQFDEAGDDAMIVEGPIHFQSNCAHHALPINGNAYVGYIPDRKLVGASKLTRVVDHYSRMFQIQERLGRQIAEFFMVHAQPKAVLVAISAEHYCMKCRGVRQQNAKLVTTTVRPAPIVSERRDILEEFYRMIDLTKWA